MHFGDETIHSAEYYLTLGLCSEICHKYDLIMGKFCFQELDDCISSLNFIRTSSMPDIGCNQDCFIDLDRQHHHIWFVTQWFQNKRIYMRSHWTGTYRGINANSISVSVKPIGDSLQFSRWNPHPNEVHPLPAMACFLSRDWVLERSEIGYGFGVGCSRFLSLLTIWGRVNLGSRITLVANKDYDFLLLVLGSDILR
jgi:hypothetical protein